MCRALGADLVIAVDLNTDQFGAARRNRSGVLGISDGDLTQSDSSESAPLFDRFLIKLASALALEGADHDTPSMTDVVTASINIMQVQITRSRLASDPAATLITPLLAHFALLDFHRAKEAIETGAAATEHVIPQIDSLLER
jgi:NTE family protein